MAATVKTVSAPTRSPERQALAAAIAAHADAVTQADRVEQAQQRTSDALYGKLLRAVEKARAALDAAKEHEPRRLVDVALGEPGARSTVADCERELADAETKVSETRRSLSLLREEAARTDAAVNTARREAEHAVAAVVSSDPARAAVLAAYRASAARALCCAKVLRTIGTPVQGAQGHGLRFVISDAATTVDRMGTAFVPDGAWQTAIALLRSDPDAEMPGLPEPEPDTDVVDGAAAAA